MQAVIVVPVENQEQGPVIILDRVRIGKGPAFLIRKRPTGLILEAALRGLPEAVEVLKVESQYAQAEKNLINALRVSGEEPLSEDHPASLAYKQNREALLTAWKAIESPKPIGS